MIKAVIFDLFGVIIADGLKVFCEELGAKDPEARRFVEDTIRANNRGLLTPQESNKIIAERLGMNVDDFRSAVHMGEIRDDRVLQLILELRKTYKTALLSNIGEGSLERRLAQSELDTYFDVVTVSGTLGVAKPDPQIYLHTATELGCAPSECVFIDDREVHCAGARSTEMQTILYQEFGQCKNDLAKLLQTSP